MAIISHKKEIAKVFMQKGYTYGLVDMSMIPSLPNNVQLKKNYYILPNTSSRTKQEFDVARELVFNHIHV